jgi:hypothetical protein
MSNLRDILPKRFWLNISDRRDDYMDRIDVKRHFYHISDFVRNEVLLAFVYFVLMSLCMQTNLQSTVFSLMLLS